MCQVTGRVIDHETVALKQEQFGLEGDLLLPVMRLLLYLRQVACLLTMAKTPADTTEVLAACGPKHKEEKDWDNMGAFYVESKAHTRKIFTRCVL